MQKNRRSLIAIIMLLIAGVLFFYLRPYADIAFIKQQQDQIQRFIATQFYLAAILFLLAYVIICACALPFGGILTFSGGYFFGLKYTALIGCIGATIGAIISFLLARYVLQELIERRYPSQLQWLNAELNKHGANYLLFIRLMPFMPYFIINPVAGLTRISLCTFTWTMAVGVIPGSAILALAGREFAQVHSLQGLLSLNMMAALSLVACFALLPMLIQKIRAYKGHGQAVDASFD